MINAYLRTKSHLRTWSSQIGDPWNKPEQKPHHSGRCHNPAKLGGKDNRARTENKVHHT